MVEGTGRSAGLAGRRPLAHCGRRGPGLACNRACPLSLNAAPFSIHRCRRSPTWASATQVGGVEPSALGMRASRASGAPISRSPLLPAAPPSAPPSLYPIALPPPSIADLHKIRNEWGESTRYPCVPGARLVGGWMLGSRHAGVGQAGRPGCCLLCVPPRLPRHGIPWALRSAPAGEAG